MPALGGFRAGWGRRGEGQAAAGGSHGLGMSGEEGGQGAAIHCPVSGWVLVSVRGAGSDRGSEVSDVQNWRSFVPILAQELAGNGGERERGGGWQEREREEFIDNQQEPFACRAPTRGLQVEVIEPGALSVLQQAAYFREAKAVLGAHGSNLANMVFMPDGAAAVEVHRPAGERGPRFNNFWHTAAALGLRYHFVTAAEGFFLLPRHAAEIAFFLLA
jgi:hypothetical protein